MSASEVPRIDLVSDTATRPGVAMRAAMANAEVGDEQRGEDPSVNALCARVASLLGKEAALFLPSGTLCNQIAVLVHCRPGDEIIAAQDAHIITSEGAGAAVLAGTFVRAVEAPRGIFAGEQVAGAVRARKPKAPQSRLVALEQTCNRGGGSVWPLDAVQDVSRAARAHALALHMDGARLLNAVVASGVTAREYAAQVDSVWLDLSKGLGCPVGAVLAGTAGFIEQAWIWKHRLGGAMRQAGILAAAGLYALDHNVERLAEDHANAQAFAQRIAAIPGIRLDPPQIDSNLVFFDVRGTGLAAEAVSRGLLAHEVRIGIEGGARMRAVTHLDVSRDDCLHAAEALAQVIAAGQRRPRIE
jgi:threonine aldolase